MKRLSGAWFKLADERGICIGLLLIPDDAAEQFEKNHERHVVCYRRPRLPVGMSRPEDNLLPIASTLHRFVIAQCPRIDRDDMLMLLMISPEEIDTEPGYSFCPNAEYLRRPVVDKTPEPETVEAGKYLAAAREVSA